MSLRIGGMGWVTPLGSSVADVWERLMNGAVASPETISSPLKTRTFQIYRVPPEATAAAPAHPRLRRSSAISRFAVVAGLAALEDAGLTLDASTAERTALIFAVSNGGVIYTKRFYHDVVESGAQAASPLLFPETVFNAPASHLAAILGITGATYTVVGDGAVGLLALKMAEDLMQNPAIDRCLVVGAEEADWLLCDAYHRWHLLRADAPARLFEPRSRGTILSEGAGAVLLDWQGTMAIEQIDAGCNFRQQNEAGSCVEQVFGRLHAASADIIIASANGTFIDAAERGAISSNCPDANVFSPKAALGESVGASVLWQVICAAQSLRTRQLPPLSAVTDEPGVSISVEPQADLQTRRAIVSACGMNQQVAGLSLIAPE